MENVQIKEEEMEEEHVSRSSFGKDYAPSELPDMLRIYYEWIFPYKEYFNWLCCDERSFPYREFSFTLQDDIYVRYQSYETYEELRDGIRKALPYKIDIGAMFSHKPKIHKSVQPGNFKAESKELVFDIDMTDYDDIRTCCSEADICRNCWKFVKIAIRIIDRALEEDFGFSHRLWVYSGRRGVHCWVCDLEARQLSQSARSVIAEYLTLIKGSEEQIRKVSLRYPLHPSIDSAIGIIDKYFPTVIEEQSFLESPEKWQKVLQLIPNRTVRENLDKEWQDNENTSLHRWNRMETEINGFDKHQLIAKEIKLQYAYPRLDVNVTKGLNHLLKSPLCIHPKTGRVCVPIDVQMIDEFDPFEVPTINQLCNEFDIQNDRKKGYSGTSLAPYMKTFIKFVNKLKRQREMSMNTELF